MGQSKSKLVSIIIVTWNGLHWLKLCLPSIQKSTYKSVEIILVDNFSSDATVKWVRQNFPFIIIKILPHNEGFAEANNQGFSISKGDYVLFLNNDVEVTPDCINAMIKKVESNKDFAGVQSKILLLDQRKYLDSVGAFLTTTGFLYHYGFRNEDDSFFDLTSDIYTPKGACMLFKRSALEQVLVQGKLFDPDAFAYFEETDMANRIWLSGKRIVYAPNAIIYHKMGGTSEGMNTANIQYHSFKNRISSYLKNLELGSLLTILPVHLVFCEIYAVIYAFRGKFSVFFAVQKAIFWNVVHVRDILRKRVLTQKTIRKISDKEYFSMVLKNPPLSYYLSLAKGVPYIEQHKE